MELELLVGSLPSFSADCIKVIEEHLFTVHDPCSLDAPNRTRLVDCSRQVVNHRECFCKGVCIHEAKIRIWCSPRILNLAS